jgi:transcriptional regulator with XRE-family HTH domain
MSLGSRLEALRRKKKLSLQDVATALEISKTHVWHLEKGTSANPSMDLLRKMADFYGVTVEFLVEADADVDASSAEAKVFFRKFQQLSEADKKLLSETLERFTKKAKS